MNKIFLSGIKPTGKLHIGNYFGFLLPFKKLIKKNPNDIFIIYIADYHSIVNKLSTKKLSINLYKNKLIKDLYRIFHNYIGKNVFIIVQSQIKNIINLSYLFTDFLGINDIFLFHAYKQYKKQNDNVKMSIITYPFLMAADILSLETDFLVVSYDQVQHLEIARKIARRFNNILKFYISKKNINIDNNIFFKIPQLYNKDLFLNSNIIPANDGKKMSKSNNNCLDMFTNYKKIKEYIMSIVTSDKVIINNNINKTNNLLFYLINHFDSRLYESIKFNKIKTNYQILKKKVILYLEDLQKNITDIDLNNDQIDDLILSKNKFLVNKANKKIQFIYDLLF